MPDLALSLLVLWSKLRYSPCISGCRLPMDMRHLRCHHCWRRSPPKPRFMCWRGCFSPLFEGVPAITEIALNYVIIPLSLAGIFVGTIMAIYEKDIKILLAQSSVAQIGYISLGFGLASAAGVSRKFHSYCQSRIDQGRSVYGRWQFCGGAWQPCKYEPVLSA